MSLDENKENIKRRKREFEYELENSYEIEIQNGMTCIHLHDRSPCSKGVHIIGQWCFTTCI